MSPRTCTRRVHSTLSVAFYRWCLCCLSFRPRKGPLELSIGKATEFESFLDSRVVFHFSQTGWTPHSIQLSAPCRVESGRCPSHLWLPELSLSLPSPSPTLPACHPSINSSFTAAFLLLLKELPYNRHRRSELSALLIRSQISEWRSRSRRLSTSQLSCSPSWPSPRQRRWRLRHPLLPHRPPQPFPPPSSASSPPLQLYSSDLCWRSEKSLDLCPLHC